MTRIDRLYALAEARGDLVAMIVLRARLRSARAAWLRRAFAAVR